MMTQAPKHLLLVDDDATQLKLNRLRLEELGFQVETASGPMEAIQRARGGRPDLIVSDVLMGELDGFGLCRRLREDALLAEVPVVLVSAHYDQDADQELARRVGAAALVSRTVDFSAELEAIQRSIGAEPRRSGPPGQRPGDVSGLVSRARAAEDRFRAVFEHAHDAMTILSPTGYILEANRRWAVLLGAPPEAMVGRHIRDFATDLSGRELSERLPLLLSSGGGTIPRVSLRKSDGSGIFVDFSVSTLDIGGDPLVVAVGRDVTASVLAAETLAAAEQKYRSLLERIPDVVWTLRQDGQVTFVTPNVLALCGYTAAEIEEGGSEAWLGRIHPEDVLRARSAWLALQHGQALIDLEYRWRKKDGSWLWVWHRASAIYEREGLCYADGILSDVTEKKRLEESYRQAQKMEAIARLTGGIAHDFNNILSTILANAHFLLADLAKDDVRRADAEEVRVAAERAAGLTRQLLAFSRRQVLDLCVVDLNGTVSGLEKMLRRLIGEDVQLEVALDPELGRVRVDAGQIEQVVMNLVVNARDAMPSGGQLTVRTENLSDAEAQRLHPGISALDGWVALKVTDTGVGMDPEVQRRIFEPFFTTKELGKGTGLGLSTCYGILKQSGGTISAQSEVGKGTTFVVLLPRVDSALSPATPEAVETEVGGEETVLLVEDEATLRAALSRALSVRGYRVLLAGNGREALSAAAEHQGPIQLVLSDVVMPGMSGPELVRQLSLPHPEMRSIYMSGYTDHAGLRDSRLREGSDFLQKPFTPEALARRVREVLDR